MKNIIIDGVEYTPVVKETPAIEETIEDDRHPGRYWVAKNDYENHFYINASGGLVLATTSAILSAECGNCYKTKEEAKKELEKRKAIVTIKRYISDTFGVFEPDWSNKNQNKCWILYDHQHNEFIPDCDTYYNNCTPIGYFSCVDHTEEIIKKFDAELRIIFDV